MKQLVKRTEYGIERVCHYYPEDEKMCYGCVKRTQCNADLFECLASYQDSGLSPEEVEGLKNSYNQLQASFDQVYQSNLALGEDLKRYKELEEQGMLSVWPCKVGDTLYRVVDRGYLKDQCRADCYSCDIVCPYEGREYEEVIEIVPWVMVSVAVIANAVEQLGKTVFLTYEEAKKAAGRGVD